MGNNGGGPGTLCPVLGEAGRILARSVFTGAIKLYKQAACLGWGGLGWEGRVGVKEKDSEGLWAGQLLVAFGSMGTGKIIFLEH